MSSPGTGRLPVPGRPPPAAERLGLGSPLQETLELQAVQFRRLGRVPKALAVRCVGQGQGWRPRHLLRSSHRVPSGSRFGVTR